MGLLKETTSEFGIAIEYWNIGDVQFSPADKYCVCKLNGYFNKVARDQGAKPVETKQIVIRKNEFDVLNPNILSLEGNNILKVLYNYTKQNREFFQDAIDILEEGEV